jgi:hypothetical protein
VAIQASAMLAVLALMLHAIEQDEHESADKDDRF